MPCVSVAHAREPDAYWVQESLKAPRVSPVFLFAGQMGSWLGVSRGSGGPQGASFRVEGGLW